jgi:signal peptidase II
MEQGTRMRTSERLILCAAILAASVGCDQVTKRIAVKELSTAAPRSFLWDVFRLQYAENRGAFLSLGADLSHDVRWWLLTMGVGGILLGLLFYALLNKQLDRLQVGSLALVFSGGFSNLIDRLTQNGVVVDFMNVGIGPLRTGIFNVADIAIVVGVVLLALPRRHPAPAEPPQQGDPPQGTPAG